MAMTKTQSGGVFKTVLKSKADILSLQLGNGPGNIRDYIRLMAAMTVVML